jgi:hypothetical protein
MCTQKWDCWVMIILFLHFEELPQGLRHFTFPLLVFLGSNILTFSLVFCCFDIVYLRWYLMVHLTIIFLMIHDIEQLTCAYWSFVCLSWRNVCSVLLFIFKSAEVWKLRKYLSGYTVKHYNQTENSMSINQLSQKLFRRI